ncbi:MAG TPA: hypothetical protein VGI45_11165 [Terracidiphilus sp.]|jgi:hypothetical protein
MSTKALLLELLVSGFFAIACFKARAAVGPGQIALRPRDFLRMTDRVQRLSRSRWQWFSMVAIIILVRLQVGVPLVVELTAALQFVIFLALPVAHQAKPGSRADLRASSPGRRSIGSRQQRTNVMPVAHVRG